MKLHQTTFSTVRGEPVRSPRRACPEPAEGTVSNHTPSGPNLPALLLQPTNPIALIVFGHGAGTPMRAPLMHQMATALARRGIATFRYDYPYSHRLKTGYTEDLIDPLDVLLATTRAAIHAAQHLAPHLPLFLAGRSMSGQVMSLLLAREPLPHVRGLICYVYPNRWRILLNDTVEIPNAVSSSPTLSRPGRLDPSPGGEGWGEGSSGRDSPQGTKATALKAPRGNSPSAPDPLSNPTLAHLPRVPVPILFIQGARDPEYCDLTQLQLVLDELGTQSVRGEPARSPRRAVSNHTLHVIPDADHAFQLPPNATRTHHDAILKSAATTATWIRHQLEIP